MAGMTSGTAMLVSWFLSLGGMPMRSNETLPCALAFVIALHLAWPIARALNISPLMIFSGPCPSCQMRPPGWWASQSNKQHVLLVCGRCGERVELSLTRNPPPDFVQTAKHSFRLRWPEFLGIWQEFRPHNPGRNLGS